MPPQPAPPIDVGASPRGRRNPRWRRHARARPRCISAWAEEPSRARSSRAACWVHLRVGGGTGAKLGIDDFFVGASPRGRRNLDDAAVRRDEPRCISAWAEEPPELLMRSPPPRVHLRVGGGTNGVSENPPTIAGASPRGRRNHDHAHVEEDPVGCISAWAEEPRSSASIASRTRVHLRVGGGTASPEDRKQMGLGASPRGRRNLLLGTAAVDEVGCISAWAEEPEGDRGLLARRRVHLRVGGGTTTARLPRTCGSGASPRGRRNPPRQLGQHGRLRCISAWAEEPVRSDSNAGGGGCISAWAEEPRSHRRACRRPRVHLRVGGGTFCRTLTTTSSVGASPRGRRNRLEIVDDRQRIGCISAWAEEPRTPARTSAGGRVHLRVGGGTRCSRRSRP